MFYANIDSPKPSQAWVNLNDEQRIQKINLVLKQLNNDFQSQLLIIAAKSDGQVVVKILNPLTASVRGALLLDFEEHIKKIVDEGLTVWGEALGDRNSLRNLRGIGVKIL